jgi:hypothetical protein
MLLLFEMMLLHPPFFPHQRTTLMSYVISMTVNCAGLLTPVLR